MRDTTFEHLEKALAKRSRISDLDYVLKPQATAEELDAAEQRLQLNFPRAVREFFSYCNGLRVDEPWTEILSVEELVLLDSHLLHFATLDDSQRLCFDTCRLNSADQWDIVSEATRVRLTMTIASFFSNRIWAWIDRRTPIWDIGSKRPIEDNARGTRWLPSWWSDRLKKYMREELRVNRDNLLPTDFRQDVTMTFDDGSHAFFKYALLIVDQERNEVAVLTEHCGYHVFPLGGLTIKVRDDS